MKKIFLIGWKDVTLAFRDRAALILMLAAPFLMTLGMGFVTGRFSSSNTSGVSQIPVAIVNQDSGDLGKMLVEVFQSNDLKNLVLTDVTTDVAGARQRVQDDKLAALVIVPAGFSDSIMAGEAQASAVKIDVLSDPARPVGSGVVMAIVNEFVNRVEIGRVGGVVSVTQLITSGRISPQQAAEAAKEWGQASASSNQDSSIRLNVVQNGPEPVKFDVLAYIAPGMALVFLMYAVTYGARSLLVERSQGTLPRLLVSPTSNVQVLAGKVLGIFLTGVAQMAILVLASALFFNLSWGDPLGVAVLILAIVFGACGWGLLITAWARTPGQVAGIGSAIMLTFGLLGGSFISLQNMPVAFQLLARITPNAWGLDGFTTLALGGSLADLSGTLLGLVVMGALLFGVSALVLNRQGLAQK